MDQATETTVAFVHQLEHGTFHSVYSHMVGTVVVLEECLQADFQKKAVSFWRCEFLSFLLLVLLVHA